MKAFIFALLLAASVPAYAATLTQLPATGFSRSDSALEITSVTPELTSIRFHDPVFEIGELMFEGAACKVTLLGGEPFRPDEGSPAVPQVTRLYLIPNTGGVELVVRNLEYELIEDYAPYPYHDPDAAEVKVAETSKRNSWYPENVVEISDPMIFRDYRVVAVTLFPVQVNPVTRQARHYNSIDVDLVANGTPGINELLNPRAPSASLHPHLSRANQHF
ncbi:MAG: hypothetical protein IPP40_07920 [bacterium]|nr:hypothetical protein [bacterium]